MPPGSSLLLHSCHGPQSGRGARRGTNGRSMPDRPEDTCVRADSPAARSHRTGAEEFCWRTTPSRDRVGPQSPKVGARIEPPPTPFAPARKKERRPPGSPLTALSRFGSPGRTRTCNLVVTRAPAFPRGLDYLIPVSSPHHPEDPLVGGGRFPRPAPGSRRNRQAGSAGVRPCGLVSARSPGPGPGGFAQGSPIAAPGSPVT